MKTEIQAYEIVILQNMKTTNMYNGYIVSATQMIKSMKEYVSGLVLFWHE